MKNLLVFFMFTLLSGLVLAQTNYEDVVYLKNGSIIRGVIIEQVPNQSISIKTADRNVFVFQMDEIERITKEVVDRKSISTSKINISIRAGLNLRTLYVDDDDFEKDITMSPGFHLGIKTEYPISDIFKLETGLLLSNKGYKYSDEYVSEGTYNGGEWYYSRHEEEKLNLFYLEIPLSAKASFNLGDNSVFGILGPYIAMGISGKLFQELEYVIQDGEWVEKWVEKYENNIKWGSDERDDLTRFDYGITAGAGIEIKSFLIELSYVFGIRNISNVSYMNNRVLGISVGYMF